MDEKLTLIDHCLNTLVTDIGPRPAGSRGQKRARDFLASAFREAGLMVETQQVECPRWESHGTSLRVAGRELDALACPHSPACDLTAPVVNASTLAQLVEAPLTGRIAVLSGALADQQYFPKNFDFFRVELQDKVIETLEAKAPLAVILISDREHTETLFCDADFGLPSVTVSDEVGALLTDGQNVELRIAATSNPGFAENIIARGPQSAGGRVIVSAHYDTTYYTSGAIDNASGVAAMVALAQLFHAEGGLSGLEFVAFGGEDSWYPIDAEYARRAVARPGDLTAVINIDGIGIKGSGDTVAFLACPEALVAAVTGLLPRHQTIAQADPWYESDHSFFAAAGIPSLALTSAGGGSYGRTHTPLDAMDQTDSDQMLRTVAFIHDVIRALR